MDLSHSPSFMTLFRFRCVNAGSFSAVEHRFVLHYAVDEGKESIVAANAYVDAGMNMSSSLAVDYVAGYDGLTVRLFAAETLSAAVASVLCGTDAFLMREELY